MFIWFCLFVTVLLREEMDNLLSEKDAPRSDVSLQVSLLTSCFAARAEVEVSQAEFEELFPLPW